MKQKPNRSSMGADEGPETKKQKCGCLADATSTVEARAADSESLDRLDDFCLSHVFSMIGDARDLFRIVFCSKRFMKIVDHEHVVRAAFLSGNKKVRDAVREVIELASERKIFTPSPIRLLRYVNGKACEIHVRGEFSGRLYRCPIYAKGKAKFGVFLCYDCLLNVGRDGLVPIRASHKFLNASPRVISMKHGSKQTVWAKPFVDLSGERCGPIVSVSDYDQVTSGENQTSIEEYLEEMDQTDQFKDKVSEMMTTLEDASKRHEDMVAREIEAKKQRNLLIVQRKVKKIKALLEDIGNGMGEVPWKSIALSCTWRSEQSCSKYPKDSVGRFNSPAMRSIVSTRHVFTCPSKSSTKKERKRICAEVNAMFGEIYEKNFHDLTFLSERAADDPFLHCFWSYYKDMTPMNDPDFFWMHMHDRMPTMIRENNLFEALAWRFHRKECADFNHWVETLPSCYSTNVLAVFRDAFAATKKHKVEGGRMGRKQLLEHNRDIILAGSTWTHCGSRLPDTLGFEEAVRKQYEDSVLLFPRLRSSLVDFTKDEKTLSFYGVEQEVNPSAHDRKMWVYFGAWGCADVYDFLLEGKFEPVRQHLLKRAGYYGWEKWQRENLLPLRPGMIFGS